MTALCKNAKDVPVRLVVEEADSYQAIILDAQGQIDVASTTVCVFGRAIEQLKFATCVGCDERPLT
jgi:hypothetical protein